MFKWFWNWLKSHLALTDQEKEDLAALIIAKLDARQYKVDQISPDKAKLIEYSNHPSIPGSLLVKYEREGGSSTHCVETPAGLGAHEVLEFLKTHEAANKQ